MGPHINQYIVCRIYMAVTPAQLSIVLMEFLFPCVLRILLLREKLKVIEIRRLGTAYRKGNVQHGSQNSVLKTAFRDGV